MTFVLQRLDRFGDGLPGDLFLDDRPVCVSLENAALAIPPGRYPMDLTISGRAQRGTLWCPAQETHPDDKDEWVLPLLLDVPGRDAIRVHAANFAAELKGCIAPGIKRAGEGIERSRAALIMVMAKIAAALADGDEAWIDVRDRP